MPKPEGAAEPDRATALWPGYYQATLGQSAGRLLLDALSRIDAVVPNGRRRRAADLGCGAGNDTVELLRRGWSVVAIDQTPEAITCLLQRPDLPASSCLEVVTADLAAATLPLVDLVNARASLPFVPPAAFAAVGQSHRPGRH